MSYDSSLYIQNWIENALTFLLMQLDRRDYGMWYNEGMYSCQVSDQMEALAISYQAQHTSLPSHQPLYQCHTLHGRPLTHLLFRLQHHMSEWCRVWYFYSSYGASSVLKRLTRSILYGRFLVWKQTSFMVVCPINFQVCQVGYELHICEPSHSQ